MPDKPSRSVFVPLLIVGVMICAGFLLLTVPLWNCGTCGGEGRVRVSIHNPPGARVSKGTLVGDCHQCEATGKVPLQNLWRGERK